MKMVKSLILGSAAGLIAMSGAQAADLPVKAKAVEYVRICSLYGAGFFYIPGTDTCIKLGGYLRADTILGSNNDYGFAGGVTGARNRLSNYYTTRARMDMTVDTRTATEYGVVRTFADLVFTWTGGGFTGSNPTAYDSTGTNATIGGAQLGHGMSASIALQDPTQYDQSNVFNLTGATALNLVTGVYGNTDVGGTRAPDIIGQFRLDQAWGLFQLSVAAHNNHVAYYGLTEPTGHPDDKWGFAVQGALSIKNIPTGPGDSLNLQGVYTDGE